MSALSVYAGSREFATVRPFITTSSCKHFLLFVSCIRSKTLLVILQATVCLEP